MSFSYFLSGCSLSRLSFLVPLFTFLHWPSLSPGLSISSVKPCSDSPPCSPVPRWFSSHLAHEHSLLFFFFFFTFLESALFLCSSAFDHLVVITALLLWSHPLRGQDRRISAQILLLEVGLGLRHLKEMWGPKRV